MLEEGQIVAFEGAWTGSFRGRSSYMLRDGLLHPAPIDADPDLAVPGTLFPRLTDHHVHLELIDPEPLLDGGITHVVDLGGDPAMTGRLRRDAAFPGSTLPDIHIAGAFLTCNGGYPSGRQWASDAAVVELSDPEEAETVVRAQAAAGASVIKVTLNGAAGPVPSPELLAAIVTASRGEGVPVAAHVEGEGMTSRALDAGVNVITHAPFTEHLDADLVARMSRAGTAVISTLDIHGWGEATPEFETALDNVRHLAAAGVRVLYGTDLGNGPLPSGVNARELAALASAGLDRESLVAGIAGASHGDTVGPRLAWVPGAPPEGASETAHWLSRARATTIDYLEETLE
ncbi:amidohydrolase family protein [Rathayibacter sp. KR2-224]|uniref:amidohydrolase family protein n=1 Tax=Rathayibacter sp. KR2-224 TaxID=3400913 RepID=UPI003BFFA48D